MDKQRILLIGTGGREHAMAWKMAQSPWLEELIIAGGNPGMAVLGECVDLDVSDPDQVIRFCKKRSVSLVVVGPEQPLVDGLVDALEEADIAAFGPRMDAARLEGSKEFAKAFMEKYQIPTAAHRTFPIEEAGEALSWIREQNRYPVVLKADGLAAGKGVFICETEAEADARLQQLAEDPALSSAAANVVVEEFMDGEEASVFVLSDGYTARTLHNAQDHKRAGDGDTGLNTGGMGAYCPAPVVTSELLEEIERRIIQPTITGMQIEESPYKGILYVGLMITDEGPKVVEYNCRFGDPECQVILPALKNDLIELIMSCEEERLDEKEIELESDTYCCVVVASGGYPQAYEKGKSITGLDKVDEQTLIFHAGTRIDGSLLVTNGGRVLNVIGRGATLKEAIDHVYQNVGKVSFDGSFYRSDIGKKGLARLA
ncbi:MAG: phosphoribosylamine--glycine ligase [Balneolaceae bacterium]